MREEVRFWGRRAGKTAHAEFLRACEPYLILNHMTDRKGIKIAAKSWSPSFRERVIQSKVARRLAWRFEKNRPEGDTVKFRRQPRLFWPAPSGYDA